MSIPSNRVSQLILNQLKLGEKGILALVVSVRKALDESEGVKGDLTEQVKSALGKLVAANEVVDVEGWFSLNLMNEGR